jgi:pilus assembly protein Flp/PilA
MQGDQWLRRAYREDERGASATEYGLLVTLIAIVITVGVASYGSAVYDWYGRLLTSLQGAGVL